METANVPVKSAWASMINWGELVKLVAMIAAMKGITIPEGVQHQMVEFLSNMAIAITAAGAIYTWVCRTWFNGSVSPSSLPKK
jgi:hypothetical protein